MKSWSKGLVFGVAALTVAWLTSITFAASLPPAPAPGATVATFAPGTAVPLHAAPALKQAAQAAAATAKPQMSEEVFKNVQVLKGIPVDEFMGTMGVFTTSLSLCCGNCHTGAGTSEPEVGRRHGLAADSPQADRARDDPDGAEHQQDELRRTPGRDVLDLPSRPAEPRRSRRRSISPTARPSSTPPDILSRDANADQDRRSDLRQAHRGAKAARRRVNALTSYTAKGKSLLFGEVGEGNPAEIYAKATARSRRSSTSRKATSSGPTTAPPPGGSCRSR